MTIAAIVNVIHTILKARNIPTFQIHFLSILIQDYQMK